MRGGSQPILARANDDQLYVVKFICNLQGEYLLFNEAAGSELFSACGLPVPAWKPMLVTNEFLDRYPECWIETESRRVRPSAGLCFASRFLGDRQTVLEILPKAYFSRVTNRENFWLAWLLDVCAHHADNRQALFLEGPNGTLETVFIDNGHMFGSAKGHQTSHPLASRYLDSRVYLPLSSLQRMKILRTAASIDADRIWGRIRRLPGEWNTVAASQRLAECLGRLLNEGLLDKILGCLEAVAPKGNGLGSTFPHLQETPEGGYLRGLLCGPERARGCFA